MKSVNFIILFAVAFASHFAHGKSLTVDLSKSEPYSGIAVSKNVDPTGIVEWVHEPVHGDADCIRKIKDGKLVFTRYNRTIKGSVVLYGINKDKFIRFPTAKGWFSKNVEWVCWHKTLKKWKRIDCTVFMYVLNRRRKQVVTWDLSEESEFIKTTPLDHKFTKFTPNDNVMVEGIIENEEALWTLADNGWKRFSHAYQFEKAGLTLFAVAHLSGQDEISYQVLAKGKHSWIPLTDNLSKCFVHIVKNIGNPCPKKKVTCTRGSELVDSVKNKVLLYVAKENEKQEKIYQIKLKEREDEAASKGVTVDFQYPSPSKLYLLRKLNFVIKKGIFFLAKRNLVFPEATFGPATIFKTSKNSPFLLIYIDNHLKRVLNAFSYYAGNTHLVQYEKRGNEWVDAGKDLVDGLFYTVDLDLLKCVDKRLISFGREMHLGAYSGVYRANKYIGISNILEAGKIVWQFNTPHRGKIYVTGKEKNYIYSFTILHDGVLTYVTVKRVISDFYFKLGDYGKWTKVSHYIKSIS